MTTQLAPYAEARETEHGWHVFWDAGLAYGSIGSGMAEEDAWLLAAKVRAGEVKPWSRGGA